ncbi:hypothetical protein [Gellertiella hungarica]|uniref:Uncharacterized protein n=1 Tax=Gellertiella hungarica TaxID=1572859 RepID=A0A7W6NMU6_9HYPH|nr:hypothetical protein [Gellertiella hungarica]MBB4066805.1 hypothetical protein [Gellertiella hungarica]
MGRRSNAMVFVVALVIAAAAGLFFFYVQDFRAAPKTRVEEPYKRTADSPPDAVEDETSHPALKDGKNNEAQP